MFEPISGWVVRRTSALKVGPFTPARNLYRSPLEDWLLRAWRAGLKHVNDNRITVLKDNTKWLTKKVNEKMPDGSVSDLSEVIAALTGDSARRQTQPDFERSS